MKAKAISAMIQTHKLSCITRRKGNFVCSCGRDAAEAELAAMQARIEKLEDGIKLAQSKLRSTQINWQEDCLFDCDDILTNTLKGDE